MGDSDREQMAKWVETWKRAGPAFKEAKRRELQDFDYEENRAIIDQMLQWACDNREVRLSSGLVEQQRIFRALRQKGEQSAQSHELKRN